VPQVVGGAVGGHPDDPAVAGDHEHPGAEQRPGPLHRGRRGQGQLDLLGADAALELVGAAGGDHPAAVEHRDPVGQPVGLLQVLRGEEDRHPGPDQLADDVPDRLPAARVQPGGRLVQEQHLRPGDQAHGQVHLAAHAAGEGLHPARRVRGQLEQFQQLGRTAPPLGPAQPPQPAHQQQVLLRGQPFVHRGELTGQADRAAHRLRLADHVATGHPGRATVRRLQRGQDPHGRRLAGAVGPEQGEHRSAGDGELDPRQHRLRPVRLAQAGRLHRRLGHRAAPSVEFVYGVHELE
jgi:hypothetical protein